MLLRYLASLVRGHAPRPRCRGCLSRPRCCGCRPRLEALEDRFLPSHDLLWVATNNPAPSVATNWINRTLGDQNNYAPAVGDSLTFDPMQTINGQRGSNSICGTFLGNDPTSFQNVTLSTNYSNRVLVGILTFKVTGNLTLAGGELDIGVAGRGGELDVGDFPPVGPPAPGTFSIGTMRPGITPVLKVDLTKLGAANTTNVAGPATLNTVMQNQGLVNFLMGNFTLTGPSFDNFGTVNMQGSETFGGGGSFGFLNEPSGSLKNTGGGTMTVAEPLDQQGHFYLNSGLTNLTGGRNRQAIIADENPLPETQLNGGNLTVSTPYLVLAGYLDGVGTITGEVDNGDPSGQELGAGVVHPGLLVNGQPPGSGGQLNITGDYHQLPAGEIWIDVQGWGGSGIGTLAIEGVAYLSGNVTINRYTNGNVNPHRGSLNFLTYASEEDAGLSVSFDNNSWTGSDGKQHSFQAVDGYNGQDAWSIVVQ